LYRAGGGVKLAGPVLMRFMRDAEASPLLPHLWIAGIPEML
jgi:hypothetical protein